MTDARLRCSIVVIGDEILGGFVQDTNSGWLAGRLQVVGVPLDRVWTVPDDHEAIAEALRTELARGRPRLVLTSGGIGSTPDDVTMEAVAAHLGRGLVVEPDIDHRITRALEWTAGRGGAVTAEHEAAMRRMARVPDGAYLLGGARGIAPGVAVDVDGGCDVEGGATIVVLPGIPGELQRITAESIEPQLLAGRGIPDHVAELTHPYPESTLSPVFARLVAEYPDVHLGSYPGAECIVRLKGQRDRVEAAMALVRAELDALAADPGAEGLRASWAARHEG
jgi:molybdenum cofactor synthesis domain-containing protein